MNALRNLRLILLLGLLGLLGITPSVQAQTGRYWTHTATAANTSGNVTYIDSTYTNGDPDVRLMVTHNWSANPVYNNHNVGVWYDTARNKWAIFNQDLAAMPRNVTFSVYAVAPSNEAFTHIATSGSRGNIMLNWTYLDYVATNNRPELKLFVTPKYNPNNVYNNHPIGVWYDARVGKWAVFNQDRAAMPNRAAFNVFVFWEGSWSASPVWGSVERTTITTHIANANNSIDNFTWMTAFPGQGGVSLFVTPVYNPNAVYNNHPVGVWYTGQFWSIFNEDLAAIPRNAAFNIWHRFYYNP
jgi:hypothetical protein